MTNPPRNPAPPATLIALLAAAILASGCAGLSTVEVESGLEKLRFHPNMHVVQAGDSIETVAFRYRLDPEELLALNPVASGGLRTGMRINVHPGTELSNEVREGGRVLTWRRRPGEPTVSPVPERSIAQPAEPVPQSTEPAADSVPPNGASWPEDRRDSTTIVATTPATAPVVVEPVEATGITSAPRRQPSAPQDMAISEARWEQPTYPREEVIPDDLGPLPDESVESLAAYTAVPAAPAAVDSAAIGSAGWVWPTNGQIARGFSPDRVDGQGIDIAGLPGQDVRAAAAGTVVYSGKSLAGDGGNLVILRHADGLMTTYAHTDRLFVTEDDHVSAGDPIASLGANEASESVLSFEVRRAGEAGPLDPLRFVSP